MNEPLMIVPSRPDAEVAEGYKAQLTKKLGEIIDMMNEAKAGNFVLNFVISRDPTGRAFVQSLQVSREY